MPKFAQDNVTIYKAYFNRANLIAVLGATALVATTTTVIALLAWFIPFDLTHHGTGIYLIPVIVAAIRWGMTAALVAAVLSAAAATFFFYDPIFSFYISDAQEVIDLIRFSVVAVVTSYLATNLKRQYEVTRKREQELQNLNSFSSKLAISHTASDIYAAIQDYLSTVLHRSVALIGANTEEATGAQETNTALVPEHVRCEVAAIIKKGGDLRKSTILDNASGMTWFVRAVSPHTPEFGLAATNLGQISWEVVDAIREDTDAEITAVSETLERLNVGRAINEAQNRSAIKQLYDALIESVSHELRTPLASIMGAATVLMEASGHNNDERISSMATIVRDEAERLNSDIQDLLDASRITSKGLQPRFEWAEPADIIDAAIERKRRRLSNHHLQIYLANDLPLINVDAVLIVQALGQVLDNAAKYSTASSTIQVAAHVENMQLILSVHDKGIGLTSDENNRLYERFFRGQRHGSTIQGSGLGLWIAQAFVTANGGKLESVSPGVGRGTTVSIMLPAPHVAENMEEPTE